MTTKYRFALALLVALLAFISCKRREDNTPPSSHPNSSKYQRIVDRFMEAGAPGVSVTIISPEGTWNGVGGMADVQQKVAMTPGHTLRIGSMTKLYTAATVLKLQEEGLLQITDKINKYVPGNITNRIANANEVTIEQCLNHTSGIRDYMSEDLTNDFIKGTISKYSAEQTLQFIYDKPATDTPGQGKEYSNSNYLLLSVIINRITGRSAYQVITEKILAPLQLQNTFASTIIPATLTRCYLRAKDKEGELQDVTHVDNNAVGGEGALDGGMIATSGDVAKFLDALLTGKLLSKQSMEMMQNSHHIDPSNFGNSPDMMYYKEYGLGLMKLATDHGEAQGHDGNVYGFNVKGYYLPAQKITLVILLNYFSPDPDSKVMKTLNVKETFNLLF